MHVKTVCRVFYNDIDMGLYMYFDKHILPIARGLLADYCYYLASLLQHLEKCHVDGTGVCAEVDSSQVSDNE